MTKIFLVRSPGGLSPSDDSSATFLSKIKQGQLVSADIVSPRNAKFLRKFFAMLDVGFDAWEPEEQTYKGQVAEKDRDRFREDITILAGFYRVVTNINGEVRLQAESISFANMPDDEQFEKVYSAVANVLLRKVLKNYTRADLDQVVERMLGFV